MSALLCQCKFVVKQSRLYQSIKGLGRLKYLPIEKILGT